MVFLHVVKLLLVILPCEHFPFISTSLPQVDEAADRHGAGHHILGARVPVFQPGHAQCMGHQLHV